MSPLTPAGPVGPDNAGGAARRSSDDLCALSALIHTHINPDGTRTGQEAADARLA